MHSAEQTVCGEGEVGDKIEETGVRLKGRGKTTGI
jgi:hypothetical protein